jgi:hypothetical protein
MERTEERALRDRARSLQALHIRLLFCRRTRDAWLAAPDDVLGSFGLSPADRSLLPDVAGSRFKAESHGRRIVVERAIGQCFDETQKYLAKRAAASGFSGADPTFDDFLCSDFFFNPHHGLPHSSGVGPGYENISKYFFWLRDAYQLADRSTDVRLRTQAYTEFAIYLVAQYQRPHDPYYDQFQGGLYWVETPGIAMPVILLSDKFVRFTLGNAETVAQLPGAGLLDLDQFAPPAWTDEAMLI